MGRRSAAIYPAFDAEARKRGLTRQLIAACINCDVTTLNRWLRGEISLKLSDAKAIRAASFPDMTLEELFREENNGKAKT